MNLWPAVGADGFPISPRERVRVRVQFDVRNFFSQPLRHLPIPQPAHTVYSAYVFVVFRGKNLETRPRLDNRNNAMVKIPPFR